MDTHPSQLPSYITSATPLGRDKRAPWFKNVAPTYAGIFLWFVFWQDAAQAPAPGGALGQGVAWALLSLVAGGPGLLLPVLPGAGPAGVEDGPAALHRGDVHLRRAGRLPDARAS